MELPPERIIPPTLPSTLPPVPGAKPGPELRKGPTHGDLTFSPSLVYKRPRLSSTKPVQCDPILSVPATLSPSVPPSAPSAADPVPPCVAAAGQQVCHLAQLIMI